MLQDAEPVIDEIIFNINHRNFAAITTWKPPKPMTFMIRKVFIPKQKQASRNFWINDKCVGCGLCESVCPENIIYMENGHPIWNTDECACCLGCIHRCPQQAIQYGKKTKNTDRYTNRNTEL